MQAVGFGLLGFGVLLIFGYLVYLVAQNLGIFSEVPWPVTVGTLAIIAGLLVLLAWVIAERLKDKGAEHFKEVER